MSMQVLADRGKKAFESKNYEEAITSYTAAIEQAPTSPDFYIQRSIAHQRVQKFQEALDDAEQALRNAVKRAKRELITEAQFRRGQALFKLKRLGDACYVFSLVLSRDKDHKAAGLANEMAKRAFETVGPEDPSRVRVVKEIPDEPTSKNTASSPATNNASSTSGSASSSATAPMSQQTPPEKIRHEWYQNSEHVYFTLLAKGVPKDQAQIDISERSLTIEFPLLTGSSYHMTLEPLFGAVNPQKCITRVLPSKLEITLAKATPGQKWANLESNESMEEISTRDTTSEADAVKRAVFADPQPAAPAYPTSSKKGPKDWDKITDNADDEEEGGGDPNDFFKKIFKGASPDMQRAMMKSYTESNGTSLSTNWDEVSKGKVETLPPDGMEAKGWNK